MCIRTLTSISLTSGDWCNWCKKQINKIVNAGGHKRFGHISKLVLALMSLPFSNASVERTFSIINIIKDKLRNRMSVETADTILRIRSNLPNGCIAFEPTEDMLNKFNSETMYSSNFVEKILDAFIEWEGSDCTHRILHTCIADWPI
ncbi:hypothetical protein ALC57_09483 [Trachymyrmex cornetzi]|uniref:HAT C-terminal dimerisation domain-containing protein n=1 Tax=Trachymyrmex cornetzi TaxID=471704 RepID=A0A151J5E0_9HYME|nr:hypothetical protein ALC57_09483 [Trachymyrmex cornetzi]